MMVMTMMMTTHLSGLCLAGVVITIRIAARSRLSGSE
jgi:hypothetical protein